jgi:hypothetical protein
MNVDLALAALFAAAVLGLTVWRTRQESRADAATPREILGVLLLPLFALILVAWLMGFFDAGPSAGSSASKFEERLPLLMTGGVVVLLLGLVATAVVFGRLRLTDSNEALGLPKGSVRAVIALSLILIFAIMSVFLFMRVSSPNVIALEGLTQAQVDEIPARELRLVTPMANTTPQRFRVSRILEDEAATDIAQQLLTTISTLVVAIAAFYFGTSSVQTALDQGGKRRIVLSSADPRALRLRDPHDRSSWEPVRVTVRTNPEGLEVRGRIYGDPAGTLTRTGSQEFTYTPSAPDQKVALWFELAVDSDVVAQWELDAPPAIADPVS